MSVDRYIIVPYHQHGDGSLIVSDIQGDRATNNLLCPTSLTLVHKLNHLLRELVVQSKEHLKEKFKSDLAKCREQYSGQELKEQLRKMKRRLDDPNVLSVDVIHNMLISFREIQVGPEG